MGGREACPIWECCTTVFHPWLVTHITRAQTALTHRQHLLLQVVRQPLTVSNSGPAAASVRWTSSHPAVEVHPCTFLAVPGSEQQCLVQITGLDVGKLQAQLVCSVEHGIDHAVEVTANVTGTLS